MTDHSPEFLSQYPASYGRGYRETKPDHRRCAKGMFKSAWQGTEQCCRQNGHGPHGAWCKQHDPEAVKARVAARNAKWEAEWDAKARQDAFNREACNAVRQIADGHNDPRGLCLEILRKLEEGKP